jgi:hypothetical protein
MIPISSRGICGEDDLRLRQEKKAGATSGKELDSSGKNGRYDPDRENFQQVDKSRFIAAKVCL